MKIKNSAKKSFYVVCVTTVMVAVSVLGVQIADNIGDVNAQEGERNLILGQGDVDYDRTIGEVERGDAYLQSDVEAPILAGDENFPAEYDLRDDYAVRTKNQHSEGTCWLQSSVTALEYSLAKKYEDYEISAKHLDYMLVDSDEVYKQAGKNNIYFKRYVNGGGYHRWSLGSSGSADEFVYGVLNPLAIMSESDFTDVLKRNDDRLASINRYEDIWSLADRDSILESNGEGYPAYLREQDYYEVNDPSKVEYIVTGAVLEPGYSFDDSRTTDSNVVKNVKKIITDYGAVKISTFGTNDRFNNCSDKKVEDGKTLYTFIVDNKVDEDSGVECKANHGMTIIGWDDDWEYEYDGETMNGAFILQNSWGESENDKLKWHLSYTSALPWILYFNSVERYSDYDHYYGVEDYEDSTIESADDEYIFEFSLDDNEEIEAFVFGNLHYFPYDYDVYVSDTGSAEDFKEDGGFEARAGIVKYEFNNKYEIAGDYAIKIKRTSGQGLSSNEKARGTINVMSDDIWTLSIDNMGEIMKKTCRVAEGTCDVTIPSDIPTRDSYDFVGYADTADAKNAKHQPGDSITLTDNKTIYAIWSKQSVDPDNPIDPGEDEDDDLPVPNTAGGSEDISNPETGGNYESSNGSGTIVFPATTVVAVCAVAGVFVRRLGNKHRKFKW